MSGSGISWAICKSAPRSRQITTPAPRHSVFTPAVQPTVKALKAVLCVAAWCWKTRNRTAESLQNRRHDCVSPEILNLGAPVPTHPVPTHLGTWLDLATSHRQTWLFSSTSMYHSTDLLTVRGVAHLVVHGTSGSTRYETTPHVQLEISGDVLSTADMVVQRRDGPRRLREIDDDEGY